MNDFMDSDKFFDSLLAMYMIANQYIKIGESIHEFHSDCALNGKSKIMIVKAVVDQFLCVNSY